MQAVYNDSAFDSASTMLFATGRDYMMRSEKRGRSGGSSSSGAPRRRPPRRRRKRAGFFYKLIMMILLLVLWPVGLVLLWQRKVRWGVGTKLLTSVVTFAACIILIGFALTVNTGNADYTAMQDRANSFLDVAADALIEAGEVVGEKAAVVYEGASDLADAAWQRGRILLADGVDYAAEKGAKARVEIEALIDSIGVEGDVAESTEAPAADQSTPAATLEATTAPEPTVEITVGPESTELPVYIPSSSPSAESGEPVETGILERGGVLSTATLPATKEPVITPEPTPETVRFTVKPASEAIVYYNEGGKCYHMASSCGTMTSAAQHSFGETADSSVRRCSKCGTPDKSILEEEFIVWTDGSGIAHLTDECAAFVTGWNIVTAAQASEEKITACTVCSADDYLTAIANGKQIELVQPEPAATKEAAKETAAPATEAPTQAPSAKAELPDVEAIALSAEAPTEEPTEAPTEEPTEAPTEEPTIAPTEAATEAPAVYLQPTVTPMMITPTRALKEAGEAIVYVEGETIHLLGSCSAQAVGAKLMDCAGKTACETCGAPLAEYAGENCLWQDIDGLCHTSDECEAFNGQYSLILRDDALEQGCAGCKICKAAEYLFSRTAINYAAIRKS